MSEVATSDAECLRRIVGLRLGLHFDDGRLGFLADVLARRAASHATSCAEYLARLEGAATPSELGSLAAEVTVAETFFFRNADQFRALREVAIPERLDARGATRDLRIVSAGCASGEEPYSLAIAAREALCDPWNVSIVGIDVNPAVLARAAAGRYSEWALRETSDETRRRWFRPEGREFVLDEGIRASVRFVEKNLNDPAPDLWQESAYDVVFCRNTIMYFGPDAARALVARIARALAPGGFLFLGHAETLRGLSSDFHLVHTHGTFYYRRKDAADAPRVNGDGAQERAAPTPAHVPTVAEGGAWVEAIRRTAERIEALAAPARAVECRREGARTARLPSWDVTVALDLVRRERFAEALEIVRELPAESSRDPDVLLLRAAVLTHCGQTSEARQVCRRLLELDELNAGAHFLLALSCEGAGEPREAADHHRMAAYLDPGFAIPRLHLGLLARRGGDGVTARRELSRALTMLQHEEPARLLLFGGGFGREALVSLCRAELAACGVRP